MFAWLLDVLAQKQGSFDLSGWSVPVAPVKYGRYNCSLGSGFSQVLTQVQNQIGDGSPGR